MKRISLIAITLLQLISFYSCQQNPEAVNNALKDAVQRVNKQCPMEIDEETRLDSAAVTADKTIQYYYTAENVTRTMLDSATFHHSLDSLMLQNARESKELEIYRTNKIVLKYTYFDQKGEEITTVTITPDEYGDQKLKEGEK